MALFSSPKEILISFKHFCCCFNLNVLNGFLFLLQFTEIIIVDHKTGDKVYFRRKTNLTIRAAGKYGKKAKTYGLWEGFGAMNSSYSYQLLICDTSFYTGFFVSGYTNCYKRCNHWCDDHKSPYFRTASTRSSYKGVAFNTNGARSVSTRLISVGLRQQVMTIITLQVLLLFQLQALAVIQMTPSVILD